MTGMKIMGLMCGVDGDIDDRDEDDVKMVMMMVI